jgi:hypothetical protein
MIEAIKRNEDDFGRGKFITDIQSEGGDHFFGASVLEQALRLGYVNGCPVAIELTNPKNTDPGRGPENMLERYGEVNFWFTYIEDQLKELNPNMAAEFVAGVPRGPFDKVGDYEEGSVPDSYTDRMSPLGTLAGYSMPRLLAEQVGDGEDGTMVASARMTRGIDSLRKAIKGALYPEELLVLFGENIALAGDIPVERVLKHVFSAGWLKEHGAESMMADAQTIAVAKAPNLMETYNLMTQAEREQLGIA